MNRIFRGWKLLTKLFRTYTYDLTKRRMKANCDCKFGLLYVKPIHRTHFPYHFIWMDNIHWIYKIHSMDCMGIMFCKYCVEWEMIEKSYIYICTWYFLIRVSYIGWSCIASYGSYSRHDKNWFYFYFV